jgi:hypothetical protein
MEYVVGLNLSTYLKNNNFLNKAEDKCNYGTHVNTNNPKTIKINALDSEVRGMCLSE